MGLNKPSIYETNTYVKKGQLMIANTSEFNITAGKIYVAESNMGDNTFHDCIFIYNDLNQLADYSSEMFMLYEGEKVHGYY